MYIEQMYTGCLAEAAYYIESDGEAAIIDPLRDFTAYVQKANTRHAKIKYVFETHFHADFVSGHVHLAEETGASIVYGPTTMQTGFKCYVGKDNEIFQLGKIKIKLIHTPGHTMESSCFLMLDEHDNEVAIFTGDTLFIGDVGRPDLAQHVLADLTEEKLAGHLYDSLRNKIMPLNDEIVVYPGHGAGSACGKKMSKETTDDLGHQKKTNYALNPELSKQDFIKEILNGLTPPPGYFPQNVLLNIQGYNHIDEIIEKGTKPLSVVDFLHLINIHQPVIIDTRSADVFPKGFIPNSFNIGLNGNFAVWVGTLVPKVSQPILLICDPDREEEVVTRLARVGYDHALGYLDGGVEAWVKAGHALDAIDCIDADDFSSILKNDQISSVLDVRKQSEFDSEHLHGALNVPLDYIYKNTQALDKNRSYYVHCAAGYRSMSFISILKSKGFKHLINVNGGFNAMKATGKFEMSSYVAPLTYL